MVSIWLGNLIDKDEIVLTAVSQSLRRDFDLMRVHTSHHPGEAAKRSLLAADLLISNNRSIDCLLCLKLDN